jgi:hypothetical protein
MERKKRGGECCCWCILSRHPTVTMDGRCAPSSSSDQGGSVEFSACALELEKRGLEWRGVAKGEAGALGPSFLVE